VALGQEALDGRVDIYSLGCVAYWLVAGTTVFDAPTPVRMLLLHAGEPPPPPSTRPGCQVPEALERLILRCLAKDPADRPQTAVALDAALAALEQHPGCAWSAEEAHRWWDAHLATPGDTVDSGAATSGVAPTLPMEAMQPMQPALPAEPAEPDAP
jgi:serine/threonine-protein kinase